MAVVCVGGRVGRAAACLCVCVGVDEGRDGVAWAGEVVVAGRDDWVGDG